jgi:hypothetical protein
MPDPNKDPQREQWEKEAASTGRPLWEIIAQARYGFMAVFIDHPELGPLLQKAAEGGWTRETFQGQLYQTNWWKHTAEATREFALLQSSDPATAQARIEQKFQMLRMMVKQSGFDISDSAIRQVATASQLLGLEDAIAQRALFAQARYDKAGGTRQVGGTAGNQIANIKARAAAYGVNIGEGRAFEYSRRIAMGELTPEGIEADLRNLAKSKWIYLKDDIDRGNTVADILDPYVQQFAQLMEVSPNSVDFNQTNFRRFVEGREEGKAARLLSLEESAQKVRTTNAWQQTRQAQAQAAGFAETIARTFGSVA